MLFFPWSKKSLYFVLLAVLYNNT